MALIEKVSALRSRLCIVVPLGTGRLEVQPLLDLPPAPRRVARQVPVHPVPLEVLRPTDWARRSPYPLLDGVDLHVLPVLVQP